MITSIIFDLGGVLFTNGTKTFLNNLSVRYNHDVEYIKSLLDGEIGSAYRTNKITRNEFWEQILNKLQINDNPDNLEKEWIDSYEIIEGTKAILEKLRLRYKVYYLSDNVKERVDALENKHHFLSWFDNGIFSHEVGIRKPDPRIYEMALQKFNIKAEEAVFIDDKPQALEPAKKLGITTILFTSPEVLKKELENRNLI